LVAAISRLPASATQIVDFDRERSAIGNPPSSSGATAAPSIQCDGAECVPGTG
jgi:hypothetical protein